LSKKRDLDQQSSVVSLKQVKDIGVGNDKNSADQ